MAEAEDLITDVARHATVYAQALWRRHRAATPQTRPVALADVAPRIELLIAAAFGTRYRLRTAQAPAPPTLLAQAFQRGDRPRAQFAVPATDGVCLWLPPDTGLEDPARAADRFRIAALQQAMRAHRGSAGQLPLLPEPWVRDLYLLIEANAADAALARQLPGLAGALNALRREALAARPQMLSFARARRPIEAYLRRLLQRDCDCDCDCESADDGDGERDGERDHRDADAPLPASPEASADMARRLAAELVPDAAAARRLGASPLFKDWWTGELRGPSRATVGAAPDADDSADDEDAAAARSVRSARLPRRPEVRDAAAEEDDARQGAWMVQAAQPQEHAEDPFGLQRPTDRDATTAAEDYADSLSELAQARLVSTPGQAREVLLSDDPPEARARQTRLASVDGPNAVNYPEWDHRIEAYRSPGATVRLTPAPTGGQPWVDATLAAHRAMLDAIRRRFAMLRAQRTRLRKQLDGDELDLDACIDSHADVRAGLPMAQALYQTQRRARRHMAILLLIDVSGSTDGWIAANRRVIDVEREALLLVCLALEGLGEPYAVQAFSGQGPNGVSVRTLKRFDEPYGNEVALRISALEPEQYTRAGAAIRHASTTLMREAAAHRLLLLLSDGKPNDIDCYDGRYGVEDTRQAVLEAKLQGVFPFCLTVDRHAASYLPAVFGAHQYAMLTKPETLPNVLLDWMKRLVIA
jgi:nitric oxide reductase NorD protein